jgi:hypothetical protein
MIMRRRKEKSEKEKRNTEKRRIKEHKGKRECEMAYLAQ